MKDPILSKLSKHLFWDCNIDALDPRADSRLVLERVYTRGTEDDEREVFRYYGREHIRNTIVNIKYLDKKTLNYLSVVFNVPREDFKCYKRSLSEAPFGVS
jgi:hypothetical protein